MLATECCLSTSSEYELQAVLLELEAREPPFGHHRSPRYTPHTLVGVAESLYLRLVLVRTPGYQDGEVLVHGSIVLGVRGLLRLGYPKRSLLRALPSS